MKADVRAHRILSQLSNYKVIGKDNEWPSKLPNGRLGDPIGCYRNPGAEGEVIGIFADGVAFFSAGLVVYLRYVDIVKVSLPSGKESEGLLLTIIDGQQIQLPVKGQHGQFFDSLEMLRFFDRVTKDQRESLKTFSHRESM